MDLVFRIAMLRRQYPDYVTPGMADAWQRDIRQGRDLDPAGMVQFELHDPTNRAMLQRSGALGTGMSFGGGGSGGGGGGGGSW